MQSPGPHVKKAFLVGGGIGSLAAAAFMIRDGGILGSQVTIFDAGPRWGGSLDAAGDAANGYSMRGGRMLTTDNYECTWNLFKTIPSLTAAGQSVFDETIAFNDKHHSNAHARLIDRWRAIVPVKSMGFSMHDRLELLALSNHDEHTLGATRITDWLSPGFFTTEFWFMWSTTFAFQPWHSAIEFRRYLHRFMLEFSRIDTLAGVKRTTYNQYDSLVAPLTGWLQTQGVRLVANCVVSDFDHVYRDGRFILTALHCRQGAETHGIEIAESDLVFIQNGSMTDSSSLGSMSAAPRQLAKSEGGAWTLWEKLADGRPLFGNPEAFNGCIAESWWGSFTVTLREPTFFEQMQRLSGNEAGTGGLVTFKDSNWLLSIVLPHQPHFAAQAPGIQVFWGYALFGDRIGNFVPKPMSACTGADILEELCGHLRFDFAAVETANCIPCRMPYITSMFMPRRPGDRPLPVPPDSKNLAFVSQFVELAEDVVFTVEYSVRAAQTAVYQLLELDLKVPPVTPHDRSPHTEFQAVLKAFE
jgi:oleate hydratase